MTPPPVAEPAAWRSHHYTQPGHWRYETVRPADDPYCVTEPLYSEATLSAEIAARVKAEARVRELEGVLAAVARADADNTGH